MGSYVEKAAIEQSKDCFDGIFINANLLESTASATTSFITTTLKDKDYAIDPITFAFSLHQDHLCSEKMNRKTKLKETSLKNSFFKLSKQYGKMTETIAGKRRLVLNDFSAENIKILAKHIIEYQVTRLSSELKSDSKYGITGTKKPIFTISPYFPIIGKNLVDWINVNKALMKESKIIAKQYDIPLYGAILLSPSFLDNERGILDIAREFLSEDCDGYLFWFDNMDEQEIPLSRAETFKKFIQEFASKKKPLINMYGGYLSILLSKHGLTGVAHGVAYWEKKQSKPISGGAAPPAKFYLEPIHERLNPIETSLIIDECKFASKKSYLDNICDCELCNALIGNNVRESFIFSYGETKRKIIKGQLTAQPTEKARLLCRKHYLRAKAKEIAYVQDAKIDELKSQLAAAKNTFEDKLDSLDLEYLNTWASIL